VIHIKNLSCYFLALALIFIAASCGSGAGDIKILRPSNQQDPFINLVDMQSNSSMYFRFLELNEGFSSICETSGVEIWYPGQFGEGISPDKNTFDINDAGLTEGKNYRVELYAKNDFNSMLSPRDGEFYGYPDCPLLFEKGSGSKVNICFGISAPDPVCGGSTVTSAPVCNDMTPYEMCNR